MEDLKKFQEIRRSCNYSKNKFNEGLWCHKDNIKCNLQNCNSCISDGIKENCVSDVSKKMERNGFGLSNVQKKAYEYKLKGKSLSWIAKKLNSKKTTVHSWIKKTEPFIKNNKGVINRNDKPFNKKRNDSSSKLKRLHNDSVSFLIHPIEFWGEPNIVNLKYSSYLKVKEFDGLYIQIWNHKLVVRFLNDIIAETVRECKDLAHDRIINFLKTFKYNGVKFLNGKFEQVSRHYAILGTSIAEKYVREKKKFYVFDKIDGKTRLCIDYSHKKPEFEAEHNIKGFSDATKTEAHFDDLINKKSYLPSESTKRIDLLMNDFLESKKVLIGYQEQIKLHLKVESNTNKLQKNTNKIQDKTTKILSNMEKAQVKQNVLFEKLLKKLGDKK